MSITITALHTLHDAPVCGSLTNDGAHICVENTGPPITMARIFKRGPRELWGLTMTEHTRDDIVFSSPNLYWLVDIHQHENQLIGQLRIIALLYPDDYRAAQQLIHSLGTFPTFGCHNPRLLIERQDRTALS